MNIETVQTNPPDQQADAAILDVSDDAAGELDLRETNDAADEGFVIRGPLDDAGVDLDELQRIESEMIEVDAALKALDEGLETLRALATTGAPGGPLQAIAPLLND